MADNRTYGLREYFGDLREVAFALHPRGIVDKLTCAFLMVEKIILYGEDYSRLAKDASRIRESRERYLAESRLEASSIRVAVAPDRLIKLPGVIN